jgi:hypothetical protein
MNARTECEWAPPPELDTGQHRINYYHRPDRLTRPPDDDPGTAVGAVAEADDAVEAALPRPQADPDPACVGDPTDPWAHATPTRAPQPTADADRPQREPFDPWAHTDTPAKPEPAQPISDAEHYEPSDPLTHTKATDTDEPEPPQPSGYAECRQPPETWTNNNAGADAGTEPVEPEVTTDGRRREPQPPGFRAGLATMEALMPQSDPDAYQGSVRLDPRSDAAAEGPGGRSPPDGRTA